MHGRRRVAAWCGRLLLFAALLLGIVTMHTLGHPRDHAPGATADAVAGAHAMTAGHAQAVAPAMPDATPDAMPGTHASASTAHRGGHGGMDPLSVCLAVLGAGWAAAFFLSLVAFFRDRPRTGPVAARAWFSRALWPIPPPPRRKALARLSVLRV
ncbi:DUF6153 family protein [Streptomyces hesseae]|uniref:DUF6153 family protein n=1 Tax=Streptomyces hesseae TaxID=3075519 RepID=A0ABU2ST27_9ACTN|nr:DUF6153 family protein [Streptomyces sp. DSM 40473]MDT0452091.1 DUF6153 family protein [Streptomyces sp. DSM 40473]